MAVMPPSHPAPATGPGRSLAGTRRRAGEVVAVKPGCGLWSAQRPERRPDLLGEQLGLFPGGEVTALVHLVEVDDVGVRLLDPAARGPPDLAGERREADRNRDRRGSLTGRTSIFLSFFPVRARSRRPGACQPVQGDVVDDVVPGEIARRLPAGKTAGDLQVAVRIVIDHPRRQRDG